MGEFLLWIFFAGICYRLREFEMWSEKARFTWMKQSDWWMNRRRNYPWWTFKVFIDSYHFFGNLARITISVRLVFESPVLGVLMFVFWWAGEYATLKLITK